MTQTFDLTISDPDVAFPNSAKIKVMNMRGKLSNIKMFGKTPKVKDIECTTNGIYLKWDESLWSGMDKNLSRFEARKIVCSQSTRTYLMINSMGKNRAEAETICKSFASGHLLKISTEQEKYMFLDYVADLMQRSFNGSFTFWVIMDLEQGKSPQTSSSAGIPLSNANV